MSEESAVFPTYGERDLSRTAGRDPEVYFHSGGISNSARAPVGVLVGKSPALPQDIRKDFPHLRKKKGIRSVLANWQQIRSECYPTVNWCPSKIMRYFNAFKWLGTIDPACFCHKYSVNRSYCISVNNVLWEVQSRRCIRSSFADSTLFRTICFQIGKPLFSSNGL